MIAEINSFVSLSLYALASKNIWIEYFAILLADGLVLIAICAYVFAMFPLRKSGGYTRTLFHDFLPGATAIAVGELWKLLFPVVRPFVKLGFSPLSPTFDTMGSFPSLHAAFIAAFATTLFFYHRRLGIFVAILVPFVMFETLGRDHAILPCINPVVPLAKIGGQVTGIGDVAADCCKIRLLLRGLAHQGLQRRPGTHVAAVNKSQLLMAIGNCLKLAFRAEPIPGVTRDEIISVAGLQF